MNTVRKAFRAAKNFVKSKLNPDEVANIVLIGETGCGKSTFINYLTNYFLKGTLDDLRLSIPTRFIEATESISHSERDLHDATKSKTDRCQSYEFSDPDTGHFYCFLDTPGLSDTRGTNQDDQNVTNILDAVEQLGSISCILIIVNGSNPRLTINMRNVLLRLRGNLPDVVLDNVIVVLTNVKRHESNFELLALELTGKVYPYYMQNSAFSTDPDTWDQLARRQLESDWNMSMEELHKMTKVINTFQKKSVTAFKDLKDIRNAIKTLMHEARLEVVVIQQRQDEIAALEIALKKYGDDVEAYKAYTQETKTTVQQLVDAPYHSTMCIDCNHVCHDHCGIDETMSVGDEELQGCRAMSNNQCTQCPKYCSYERHYHARKTVETKEITVSAVLEDIKAKYDYATQGKLGTEQELSTVAEAKEMLKKALDAKNKEIQDKCNELRKICSGFNIVDELCAMITQLQMEAKSIKNVETRKQADEFIRSLTEFCTSLENDTQKKLQTPMKIQNTYQPIKDEELPFRSRVNPDLNRRNPNPKGRSSSQSRWNNHKDEENEEDNTEVAARLKRIMNRGKPPGDAKSESPSTITQNNTEKATNRFPRQPVPASTITTEPSPLTADQINLLTNHDLLSRHAQAIHANDTRNLSAITSELQKRALGRSSGPLNAEEQDIFFNYLQHFNKYDSMQLRNELWELQDSLSKMIENDIQQLSIVPRDKLLKVAAAYKVSHNQPSALSNTQPLPVSNHHHSFNSTNTKYNSSGNFTGFDVQPNENFTPSFYNSYPMQLSETRLGPKTTTPTSDIGFKSIVYSTKEPDLPKRFQALSIEDQSTHFLVESYKNACHSNNSSATNRIREELNCRITGKRYGLLNENERQNYRDIENQLRQLNFAQLHDLYIQLRDHIVGYVQDDYARLDMVPSNELLRLNILYTLTQNKSTYPRDSPFRSIDGKCSPYSESPYPASDSYYPIINTSGANPLGSHSYSSQAQRTSPYLPESNIANNSTGMFAKLTAMEKMYKDRENEARLRRQCGTDTIDFETNQEAALYDKIIEQHKHLSLAEIQRLYDITNKTITQPHPYDPPDVKARAAEAMIHIIAFRHIMQTKN